MKRPSGLRTLSEPSDYTNYKITEPTKATISLSGKDAPYREAIQRIADKYIFKHIKQTEEYIHGQMIFEITDDEALDLFDNIIEEAKKALAEPDIHVYFYFELMIDYLNADNRNFFTRKLGYYSTTDKGNSGSIVNESNVNAFELNRRK